MPNKGPEIQIGDGSLHAGDRVVYPNQGICKITGVEVKQIAGRDWEMVTLSREEDGATVMVPRSKVMEIGLRKVASVEAIDGMFDQLAAPSDDPQLDWKIRHRENADRMTGGGLQGTLDVLKGLHALSQVRPLPQKERELYDNARHLLVGEISAAMNIPLHVAEDNLDYALFPPPGMTRKGVALKPATVPVPGAAPLPARGSRGADESDDEDAGLEEEEAAPAATEGEPADAVAADEEESEIADRSETKDLVRQRAMRVAAQAENQEPLDELAEEALEATHEDEAGLPGRKARAPAGSGRPETKRAAARTSPRPKAGPGQNEEPKRAAKAIAAKVLEAAAKAIAPAKHRPAHEEPEEAAEETAPAKVVAGRHAATGEAPARARHVEAIPEREQKPHETAPRERHAETTPERDRHAHEPAVHERHPEEPALPATGGGRRPQHQTEEPALPATGGGRRPQHQTEEPALPATGGGRRPQHPTDEPALHSTGGGRRPQHPTGEAALHSTGGGRRPQHPTEAPTIERHPHEAHPESHAHAKAPAHAAASHKAAAAAATVASAAAAKKAAPAKEKTAAKKAAKPAAHATAKKASAEKKPAAKKAPARKAKK